MPLYWQVVKLLECSLELNKDTDTASLKVQQLLWAGTPELEAGQDFKPPPLPEKPACLRKLRPDPISPARQLQSVRKCEEQPEEEQDDDEGFRLSASSATASLSRYL